MSQALLNVSPEPCEWSLRIPWLLVLLPRLQSGRGNPSANSSRLSLAIAGMAFTRSSHACCMSPHTRTHQRPRHDPTLTVRPGLGGSQAPSRGARVIPCCLQDPTGCSRIVLSPRLKCRASFLSELIVLGSLSGSRRVLLRLLVSCSSPHRMSPPSPAPLHS